MKQTPDAARTARYEEMTRLYAPVIAKVCYLFAGPGAGFDDLYQETLLNLWVGMDSFRGDAAVSTWIYRMAINTCITWHRRNDRHSRSSVSAEEAFGLSDPDGDAAQQTERLEELRMLHELIAGLNPIDKAIITLWLDERPYDEIAAVTGISKSSVAVKIHRIKARLVEKGKNL